jgi:hypothetical protein
MRSPSPSLLPRDATPPSNRFCLTAFSVIGVQQGVTVYCLKFHPGLPCPTLLCPTGEPPLKRPYSHCRGDPPAGWAFCGRLLLFWTPHAVRRMAFSVTLSMSPPPTTVPEGAPTAHSTLCFEFFPSLLSRDQQNARTMRTESLIP